MRRAHRPPAPRRGARSTQARAAGGGETSTSVEENIRIIEAAQKAINERDWDRFLGLQSESVVLHSSFRAEPVEGRAAVREFVESMTVAFPDLRVEKRQAFGQGDWVFIEQLSTGTHKGPMQGPGGQTIPPTNKAIQWPVAFAMKVENGKIAEVRQYVDRLGVLSQLGVAPPRTP